jgi:hypothetical protein
MGVLPRTSAALNPVTISMTWFQKTCAPMG